MTGEAYDPDSWLDAATFKPHEGRQTDFLTTPATIAFYGGAAGGGKSVALMMESCRHLHEPGFSGCLFRETEPELRAPHGLLETSKLMYPQNQFGGKLRESSLTWHFPSGASMRLSPLQYDKDKEKHKGAEYAFLGWDELTNFSEERFWYLLSRNRSTCNVKPYVRATTNPAPNWVAKFIAWYLNEEGYPIEERSGHLRYYIRIGDDLEWANHALPPSAFTDRPQHEVDRALRESLQTAASDLYQRYPDYLDDLVDEYTNVEDLLTSFTFIPAKLTDNPTLMKNDRGYKSKLAQQGTVERERLLAGNWFIDHDNNALFKKSYFHYIDLASIPEGRDIRFWDLASTSPHKGNKDPDWTVGVKMRKAGDKFYILHVARFRESPGEVRTRILQVARTDGRSTSIYMEQEGGSSGVNNTELIYKETLVTEGFTFEARRSKRNKEDRAQPLSAAMELGKVFVAKGEWNEEFERELCVFPKKSKKDDQVDAASGAYSEASAPSAAERAERRIKGLSKGLSRWG